MVVAAAAVGAATAPALRIVGHSEDSSLEACATRELIGLSVTLQAVVLHRM
jgi:hypothetical protein